MTNNTNPIKNKCRDIINTKPDYRKAEIAYLRYMMVQLSQEDLIKDLKTLNIRELKYAIGAGVPGKAMHEANRLLQEKKERMEAFIEKDGSQAAYEHEYKDNSTGEEVSTGKNDSAEDASNDDASAE